MIREYRIGVLSVIKYDVTRMWYSHGGEHGRNGRDAKKKRHVDIHVGEDEVTRAW